MVIKKNFHKQLQLEEVTQPEFRRGYRELSTNDDDSLLLRVVRISLKVKDPVYPFFFVWCFTPCSVFCSALPKVFRSPSHALLSCVSPHEFFLYYIKKRNLHLMSVYPLAVPIANEILSQKIRNFFMYGLLSPPEKSGHN